MLVQASSRESIHFQDETVVERSGSAAESWAGLGTLRGGGGPYLAHETDARMTDIGCNRVETSKYKYKYV